MINIGVLAHVDAGKTTITENILYLTGATRKLGSVDDKSAVTDYLAAERERGISIQSATTSFTWKNRQFNLIDTPGHVDFSAEVERVLSVLDVAILVVSAVEGIQAQTITIFETLKHLKIPSLVFVNKIDRSGSDVELIISEFRKELGHLLFPMNMPENEAENNAGIRTLAAEENAVYLEELAAYDDQLLEKLLEGQELTRDYIHQILLKQLFKAEVSPMFCGIAKTGLGIEFILNYLSELEVDDEDQDTDLSALVFKVEHDQKLGRLAHVRVYSGSIKNRDLITNFTQNCKMKVAQTKKYFTNKLEDISEISAGDIAVISGLTDVQVGDVLGKPIERIQKISLAQPLLLVQVKPKNAGDFVKLTEALQQLNTEDPNLNFNWIKEESELTVKLSGPMQKEVLGMFLSDRFGIDAEFGDSTVIYKETPSKAAEGFVRYWMPKPCWAIMKLKIEPGEPGSGISFESKVSVNDIRQKYQNEVERTIPFALKQGIKGWEVTDLKITLVEGEDHEVHSNPGDFVIATPMGLMRALENSGTTLMEPVMSFEIKAEDNFLGAITSEITNMRGEFNSPEFEGNRFKLTGKVPAATSVDFPIKLNSLTAGKAKLRMRLHTYQACSDEQGTVREYKGVNPLDESKWILHARGAYKRNEWKMS